MPDPPRESERSPPRPTRPATVSGPRSETTPRGLTSNKHLLGSSLLPTQACQDVKSRPTVTPPCLGTKSLIELRDQANWRGHGWMRNVTPRIRLFPHNHNVLRDLGGGVTVGLCLTGRACLSGTDDELQDSGRWLRAGLCRLTRRLLRGAGAAEVRDPSYPLCRSVRWSRPG